MKKQHFDLCIIGGGINGAGIARDAALRGLSVALIEARDLASSTSSASSKLIHGGLRYLEYYEFKLVRAALREREKLLGIAPHIIWPLQFILPHDKTQRPAWMIRIGLFLYDNLAKRKKLPGSYGIKFKHHVSGKPLQKKYKRGFSYADCWVNDARLVALNALDAKEHDASIMTRTACTRIEHNKVNWRIHTRNLQTHQDSSFTADKVVNAAGPWVRGLMDTSDLSTENTPNIRLVKGSHIVVPQIFNGDHAYILQQPDHRIVFAIPYEGSYTLIGTTDVEIHEDPANVQISEEEIEYLCNAANLSFEKQISKSDIVWSYSGVRPLLDDGDENASAVTRDYKLIHDTHDELDLLSVFGGKITTYRTLAKSALDKLYKNNKSIDPCTTDIKPLPGGDIDNADFDSYASVQSQTYKWLPDALLYRYLRAYGSRIDILLGDAGSTKELGIHFGDDLYENEVNYLIEYEFAMSAEDILWRRSKLGLHISSDTKSKLEQFMAKQNLAA